MVAYIEIEMEMEIEMLFTVWWGDLRTTKYILREDESLRLTTSIKDDRRGTLISTEVSISLLMGNNEWNSLLLFWRPLQLQTLRLPSLAILFIFISFIC